MKISKKVILLSLVPNALVAEGTAVDSDLGERASQASSSTPISPDSSTDSQSASNNTVKGKDKENSSTLKSDNKLATKDKKEVQNLIGKINNLVTTDLGNIVGGADFLLISALQSFCLDLLSDALASSLYSISNSSVHHLLIWSTWMEVSLSSYFYLFARVNFILLIIQVPLLVSLPCLFCFQYPDILGR